MDTEASPEALFKKNSRSFSLAARFFAPEDRLAVARLYRLCRYLDDLADDTYGGDASSLNRARARLNETCEVPHDSIEADFLALAQERAIPLQPALSLIDALLEDCGPRAIANVDELIRFAYGVAGTVGQMMRHVIGAHDPRADPFALDLGIGLQLSNIIRDITEDARRGRFYLPAEWVRPDTIQEAIDGDETALDAVDQAIRQTLKLSESYYQSARRGFVYIQPRNRKVIFLAASLYEAIGKKVARLERGLWRQRTVIGIVEKGRLLIQAPFDYRMWLKSVWTANPQPQHDAALHRPLEGELGKSVISNQSFWAP